MKPLGRKQIELLLHLGKPSLVMLTPDSVARSLVARGLLEQKYEAGGPVRITAYGMRVLADYHAAGELDSFMTSFKDESWPSDDR